MAKKFHKLPGRRTSAPISIERSAIDTIDDSNCFEDIETIDWIKSIDPTGFFLDFYNCGSSLKIYAELHKISYNAAKMRLSRARKRLQWNKEVF